MGGGEGTFTIVENNQRLINIFYHSTNALLSDKPKNIDTISQEHPNFRLLDLLDVQGSLQLAADLKLPYKLNGKNMVVQTSEKIRPGTDISTIAYSYRPQNIKDKINYAISWFIPIN